MLSKHDYYLIQLTHLDCKVYHNQFLRITMSDIKQVIVVRTDLDMGKGKIATELGLEVHDAELLLNRYHKTVPFIKELQEIASRTASRHGHIRTLLGRKCRFTLWEPNRWGISTPLPRDRAEAIRTIASLRSRAKQNLEAADGIDQFYKEEDQMRLL